MEASAPAACRLYIRAHLGLSDGDGRGRVSSWLALRMMLIPSSQSDQNFLCWIFQLQHDDITNYLFWVDHINFLLITPFKNFWTWITVPTCKLPNTKNIRKGPMEYQLNNFSCMANHEKFLSPTEVSCVHCTISYVDFSNRSSTTNKPSQRQQNTSHIMVLLSVGMVPYSYLGTMVAHKTK